MNEILNMPVTLLTEKIADKQLSSKEITESIASSVFSNLYSSFLLVHGPMKITFAVGSAFFISFAERYVS